MAERIVRDNRRAFKGVWIPAEFYLDPNLSIVEMIVLTEIDSLDNEYGCVASNKHFAEFVGLSKNRASEIISSLKNKGFITIQYSFDDLGQKRRTMRLNRPTRNIEGGNRNIDRPTRNTEPPYSENRLGYSENREGYSENRDCRNTSKNTARNTSIGIQLASSAHATQSEYIQRGATATSQAADDDAGRSKPTGQALANAGATAPVAKPQRTAGQTTQQRGWTTPADPAGPNSLDDPNGLNMIFNTWADLWDWPSKSAVADLKQWVQEFGAEVVLHAIKKAAQADAKRPYGYVAAIMRDYHQAGYKNLQDVEAAEQARVNKQQQTQAQNYGGNQYGRGRRANVQETLPSWAETDYEASDSRQSDETVQVEKNRALTAEHQLGLAIKMHRQLFYGDLETIRENLSKPDGHGYMSIDAPKLFKQYLAQQGQGAGA